MGSPLSPKDKNAVRWYVEECNRNVMRDKSGCAINSQTVESRITNVLHKQAPLDKELILWRGHAATPMHVDATTWFSTSSQRKSAKNLFTNSKSGCCLFKLHIMPGIRVLNVKDAIVRHSPTRKMSPSLRARSVIKSRRNNTLRNVLNDESEWLVEGGGVFYKTPGGGEKGFVQKPEFIEAYYYPKQFAQSAQSVQSSKKLSAAELKNLLDKDEYELVDGPNYFNVGVIPSGHTASPSTKQKAFELIQLELTAI